MMEILQPTQYDEYETFAASNPYACFTQSICWTKVKNNWGHEVVVSRNHNGEIVGGMLVLVRKIVPGLTFLYAPRGPVADICNKEVMLDLLAGARLLSKKHGAFGLKIDPMIRENDTTRIEALKALGFRFQPDAEEYDTIQRRYNYILPDISHVSADELLASFKQKCRYNIRVAQKHGVTCRACGEEGLDEFVRLSKITGERDAFDIRSREYYARMLSAFGPDHMRIYLCEYQGHAISGSMTCNWGGTTSYIYGASDNEYRNVMPNYMMQWTMMQWALETHCRIYDFMGISAKLDENSPMYGVYRFKTGFNGEVAAYAGEFDYVFKKGSDSLFRSLMSTKKAYGALRHKLSNHSATGENSKKQPQTEQSEKDTEKESKPEQQA